MVNLDEKRYVALIGLSGCGKTTFSHMLADALHMKQVDTDDLICEMSGHTIPELFSVSEDHFRDWEEKALASIAPDDHLIVACGGGIIKRQACRDILRRNALVIYIDRPPEHICSDVDTSGRPLLKGGAEQIYRLYEERKVLYEEAADVVVPNTGTREEALEIMKDAIQFMI
ncbi:MAG: shikimate kinase [Clostridia bacterium]|nr:shikimate kinase [Clostridia bacterium]